MGQREAGGRAGLDDITVLKTAHIYETDMLTAALEQAGVPHYRRLESLTAGEFAMPAFPVQGPGVFYKVIVPAAAAAHARQILAELPIQVGEREFWSYNPRPWARRFIWWSAVLTLGGLALSFLWNVVETVQEQRWFE